MTATAIRPAPCSPIRGIHYILSGLPRQGRGKVRWAGLGGTAPVDGVWPSDHFAVVADLNQEYTMTALAARLDR